MTGHQWSFSDQKDVNNLNYFIKQMNKYLAKSSFKSLTSSSAVHWSDNVVKPQISANKILK